MTIRIFSVSDEKGSIDFNDTQGIVSRENTEAWFAVSQPFLLLDPDEFRSLPYVLTIPRDAPFGTYSLAVIFQSKLPEIQSQSPTAQLLPAIGALFFIDVAPKPGEQFTQEGALHIEDFSIPREKRVPPPPTGASVLGAFESGGSPPAFIERVPLSFSVRVKNIGRYIARPTGEVAISDIFGRTIGLVPFPDGAVLPQATRLYTVTLDKPLRFAGLGFAPEFLQKSFLPGRYSAHLSLQANALFTRSPEPKTLMFWAFPRALMLSTAILTLCAVVMVLYRRRIVFALKMFLAVER